MKENRREFLKKSGCALSMVTMATQFQHFGLMSALAQKVEAEPQIGDPAYKALVCVFMAGGNDGNNLVVPNHSSTTLSNYATYAAARSTQGLAIDQAQLLPITVPRIGGLTYGLHPALGPVTGGNNGIYELYAQNKLAIVSNVGTLVQPTTRAQFLARSVPLPYQLQSHSDQVDQFQSGVAGTFSFTGWGGRIADKMTPTPVPTVPMVTSIAGAQIFTAGQSRLPMAINNAGTALNQVLNPAGFNTTTQSVARRNALLQIKDQDVASSSRYISAAAAIADQALDANAAFANYQEVTTTFPNTNIAQQLKQVARIIKNRGNLTGVTRQIFYVQIGSFDTHNGQVTGQAGLLGQMSQAMRAFYDEMGVLGTQESVTMFTMSDFGRTFNPASTGVGVVGSDHAWANHMLVLGGSVIGGNFYGMNTSNGTPYPSLIFNGPDDMDSGTGARGRWIPTTSVDQYAATLANWYGLTNPLDVADVFPNLDNFGTNTNLGFMTV